MAGVFYSLETEKWRNWGRGYERDDREQALLGVFSHKTSIVTIFGLKH